jgi:hypothetical protein
MNVVKVVDHDIFDKVDTQYIENQFSSLQGIGIVFICTREGGEEDDWTEEDGMRYIVIHLPYEEVRQSADARPMMLAKVKEQLGLVA